MKKMMIFLMSAIALLTTSCAEKDAFTIKGKLPSGAYDGEQVYLQKLDENWKDRINIDTVQVVDGEFVFKGLAKEGPAIHFVVLNDESQVLGRPVAVIVEPGEIEVTIDSISNVKGTNLNNAYQAYQTKVNALNGEMKGFYEKAMKDTANTDLKNQMEKQFNEKNDEITKETYDYLKSTMNNQVGAYLFSRNYYRFSLDQQKELNDAIKPEFKSLERLQKINANITALDATSVGKTYTDIKGKTPEGNDAALSDYVGKGKYVLVDFWASWCGPCRAETPKLVELYKTYKDKDFEIVGISLDKEEEAWKAGIKNLNITWPQISDLKFWDSELSAVYGISSIPHLVLIDKDGKIIERGISADEAVEKIKELLD